MVTGLGAICSIAKNATEFWSNCINGVTNVQRIPRHWLNFSDFDCQFWAPLECNDALVSEFSRVQRLTLDPCTRLAILTTKEALENAGFNVYKNSKGVHGISGVNGDRFGVFMGTGVGGISSLLQNHTHPVLSRSFEALNEIDEGNLSDDDRKVLGNVRDRMVFPRRVNPFIVSMLMPNAVSANVGLNFGLTGQNTTYAVACAAGTVAIGNAYRAIQRGEVSVAIAGGAEYLDDYHGYIFRGFDVAGTLARGGSPERINCPFDEARSGFLFSQGGAASLVLEDLEFAKSRNAPIIAEVVGFGETFDAYNIMQMGGDTNQIRRMITRTLKDADLAVNEIDYINAHGTGTVNNDEIEAKVLYEVFGDVPYVNSTKSLVGHTIGASGALEAVVLANSIKFQTTHNCKHLTTPINQLNYVREVKSFPINYALSQSFAFGGHNTAIVFGRYDAE